MRKLKQNPFEGYTKAELLRRRLGNLEARKRMHDRGGYVTRSLEREISKYTALLKEALGENLAV